MNEYFKHCVKKTAKFLGTAVGIGVSAFLLGIPYMITGPVIGAVSYYYMNNKSGESKTANTGLESKLP